MGMEKNEEKGMERKIQTAVTEVKPTCQSSENNLNDVVGGPRHSATTDQYIREE